MEWNGTCPRCHQEADAHMMSRFSTRLVCMPCIDRERQHASYPEAERAEFAAIKRGDHNFPGIGEPADL